MAKRLNRVLTITSGIDGTHSAYSKHYQLAALDLRTYDVPDVGELAKELRKELGPQYDVVIEPDHIHLEWDPK